MALAAGVATGFQFVPVTREALEHALIRAAAIWRQPRAWRALQKNGMTMDVGWDRAAKQYARLYRELVRSGAKKGAPREVRSG
jgi:starch synthase